MELTRDGIFHKDIMLEILLRLPVKSLLRFRQVCKNWKSLITSYHFRKLHRKKHSSSPPLILTFHGTDPNFKATYKPDMQSDYCLTIFDLHGELVQQFPLAFSPCHMISIPYQSKLLCFKVKRTLFSYNPSTRQTFLLPAPPCLSLPDFDPYIYTYHFGYIPSKDEYMLVTMVYGYTSEELMCEVLTISISDDNFQLHYSEWRSIKVTKMFTFHCVSVFVLGTLYGNALDENFNVYILSLEVDTGVIATFALPRGVDDGTLIELKNELYLMVEAEEDEPPTLDMWKLCTDVNGNKSWTLHWNINLQTLGYQKQPSLTEFDWRILIYRLEYLELYKDQNNVLREMGKLKLDKRLLEEDGESDPPAMPHWDVDIHSNLFTL